VFPHARASRRDPRWSRWNRGAARRYTIGVEEELVLLHASTLRPAQISRTVRAFLSRELRAFTSTETHASVLELKTGINHDVTGAVAELAALREGLANELATIGLCAACAGTYPLDVTERIHLASTPRCRVLADSMRSLARRDPTMALHVHVGVADPDEAIRLINGLRRHLPLLLALSANSPFCRGRDGGFASERTVIFQAFPRTGTPREFDDYADYVQAVDALVASDAIPDPSFLWWDVRPQPALGTVEVRLMDAQATIADCAPLIALVQSLARLELEGEPPTADVTPEVLAENRFLAARDGMEARLIDPSTRRSVPVRALVESLLASCRPHAAELGGLDELEEVSRLATANGAYQQRRRAQAEGLEGALTGLAEGFTMPAAVRSGTGWTSRPVHPCDAREARW
jgi:glutamate---cysteine ligase / carboxylate-amine ligase